ncbi:MAG TPA: maltose ABC transporter permease MalF [Candidatus Limnocylindrales bacterium]|nr:maltose ABC transporter permease MalF [Candidatus Limnocylindrales bacterium]
MTGQQGAPRRGAPSPIVSIIWRLIALALIDAVAIVFAYAFFGGGLTLAAIVLLVITAVINVVFLVPGLYPLRWISPGLMLLVLMVVYPVLYTVYIAFTNYNGVDHLLSKDQVVARLESTLYTPEETANLAWRAYRSPEGQFLIWLTQVDGTTQLADPLSGIEQVQLDDARFGAIDPEDGLPATIGVYTKLGRLESFRYLTALSNLVITDETAQLRIISIDRATLGIARFSYDPVRDVVYDDQTDTEYFASGGYFVDAQGNRAPAPGFVDFVGLRNFERALSDPRISSVFFSVLGWTIAFSFLSVVLTFAVGLALALVFNDDKLPLKGLFRTLAIIPYTIPGFISALVWAGLLNPNFGPINGFLSDFVGMNPQWFSDGNLAKMAVLIVNTWLGYPYMMIVSLGALQSIPSDLYEAAEIDGASPWQRFRTITFPLLLVALAPLLIGSFAFNFNNFTLIELLTEGRPPQLGVISPAGQTDILISYSFRVAFAAGRGQDYAFAAALGVFIFLIVAAITIVNFRLSRRLENMI